MNYLPINQCIIRKIYKLNSRNLSYGVFTAGNCFIGIRTKFGDRYLAKEYHYDTGAPFGTAKPLQEIGEVPSGIILVDRLGSFDRKTDREVKFDKPVDEGGKGWYYLDTGISDKNIMAYGKHNDLLFEYLDSIKLSETD